jgi:hypothetical protein
VIDYEKAYRQGEIIFLKVKKLPDSFGYTRVKSRLVPNGVIREGEKEGHEHKVEGDNVQLSLFGDGEFGTLKVDGKSATVTHPEHKDIKLPKGDYVVKVQKEATGKNRTQTVKD